MICSLHGDKIDVTCPECATNDPDFKVEVPMSALYENVVTALGLGTPEAKDHVLMVVRELEKERDALRLDCKALGSQRDALYQEKIAFKNGNYDLHGENQRLRHQNEIYRKALRAVAAHLQELNVDVW